MSIPPHDPRPESTPLPAEWVERIDAPLAGQGEGTTGEGTVGSGPNGEGDLSAAEAALVRARRQAAVLRSLPRLVAPPSLDGATVAALNEGQRQDRAASVLSGMERQPVPAALDAAVEALISASDDTASPNGLRAPAALDGLVAQAIASDDEVERALRSDERLVVRRRVTVGAGFALAVFAGVLVFGLGRGNRAQDTTGASTDAPSFVQIVPVTVESLSPAERDFLRSFGGPLYGGAS